MLALSCRGFARQARAPVQQHQQEPFLLQMMPMSLRWRTFSTQPEPVCCQQPRVHCRRHCWMAPSFVECRCQNGQRRVAPRYTAFVSKANGTSASDLVPETGRWLQRSSCWQLRQAATFSAWRQHSSLLAAGSQIEACFCVGLGGYLAKDWTAALAQLLLPMQRWPHCRWRPSWRFGALELLVRQPCTLGTRCSAPSFRPAPNCHARWRTPPTAREILWRRTGFEFSR